MDTPHPSGEVPAGTPDPEPRVLHGRYRIEKALGRGGMGEVLLAVDELLHRRVALKRMHATGADRAERRRAMLKEARRASQINDRHVASIYDVLDAGDEITLVMEYVNGVTLRQRMTTPVPLEEFYSLATQCVEGVAAAHAHGVVHRDIKPENLMVTGGGEVKILDFGIARSTAPGIDTTTSLTDSRERGVAGTPHYMAPEAHLGTAVDERTDIFSLGVVFYELLTTRRPFEGGTYGALLGQVLNTTPPPVTDSNPAAGPRVSAIVSRMLAKDPVQRFASARDLLKALNGARMSTDEAKDAEWATTQPTPPRTAPVPSAARAWHWPSSRRIVAGLAIMVAVAVAAGIWWRSIATGLPREVTLAVLPPETEGAPDDFTSFALGATFVLSNRLQRYTDRQGFQLLSLEETLNKGVRSAGDGRKLLGANVVMGLTLEQKPDQLRGRVELRDTEHDRVIASRIIETPASQPFDFMDRLYQETSAMLGRKPRGSDTGTECGFRGAGTLRFYLQGVGLSRSAKTDIDARKAVQDLELACQTEPTAALAHAGLSSAQLKVHSLTRDSTWLATAEASARRAIELAPDRSEPHLALGFVFEDQKRPRESAMEFARAIDLNPTDDVARHRLGRAYARMKLPEREEEAYRTASRQMPHWYKPYWWLATLEFRAGRVDDAIGDYRQMIRRAPLFETGYASLGGVLILKGDYERAIEMLRHAVALRPSMTAYSNLGTAYFNSGRFAESVDAYNQSFQFGTPDYVTWLNLGDAFLWLRDRKDDAAGAYRRAIDLGRGEIRSRAQLGRPAEPMIFADLATVFPRLEQPDTARAYLDEALRADSMNSRVQYCAALTYWQLEDRARAMTWITKSVQGGYPRVWLRDSPVFNEWREIPEFQELVAEPKPEAKQAVSGNPGG